MSKIKREVVCISDILVSITQLPKDNPGYLNIHERAILGEAAMLIDYRWNTVTHPQTKQRMSIRSFSEFIGADRRFVGRMLNSLELKGYITIDRTNKNDHRIIVSKEIAWRGWCN